MKCLAMRLKGICQLRSHCFLSIQAWWVTRRCLCFQIFKSKHQPNISKGDSSRLSPNYLKSWWYLRVHWHTEDIVYNEFLHWLTFVIPHTLRNNFRLTSTVYGLQHNYPCWLYFIKTQTRSLKRSLKCKDLKLLDRNFWKSKL